MTNQDSKLDAPVNINRVPLWLAVAVTVLLSMPFGLWLGKFNFPLWCSFIVWAQYFALGAKPQAVPTILKSFGYSAFMTGAALALSRCLDFLPSLVTPHDLALSTALFIGVAFMVYSMAWSRAFQEGSLPFFNGISMALAVYFSGSFPHVGPDAIQPIVAAAWALVMGAFGILLGMFTVVAQLPTTTRH